MTVITHSQREHLRRYYSGKKYIPKDLRPKLTRALRRQLTPSEAARKTERQRKKDLHFPKRKYAIKAI